MFSFPPLLPSVPSSSSILPLCWAKASAVSSSIELAEDDSVWDCVVGLKDAPAADAKASNEENPAAITVDRSNARPKFLIFPFCIFII